MIVDFHCHAGQGDRLTHPANTVAPVEPYLRRARAAGIGKTVVFAPFHSDYSVASRLVAGIVPPVSPVDRSRLLTAPSNVGGHAGVVGIGVVRTIPLCALPIP